VRPEVHVCVSVMRASLQRCRFASDGRENDLFRATWQLRHRYGLHGMLRLGRDWVATRFLMPQARILRQPAYIRGKHWMEIGSGFTTGPRLRLDAFPVKPEAGPVLRIGRDVQVNDGVHIAAVSDVRIGDRVLIASRVYISDHNHGITGGAGPHTSPEIPPSARPLSFAPIVIEDDVWIGEGVCVLPGVRIGKGSIVGAQALVNRDVPPYTIVAGSPSRVVKRFNFETSMWEPV